MSSIVKCSGIKRGPWAFILGKGSYKCFIARFDWRGGPCRLAFTLADKTRRKSSESKVSNGWGIYLFMRNETSFHSHPANAANIDLSILKRIQSRLLSQLTSNWNSWAIFNSMQRIEIVFPLHFSRCFWRTWLLFQLLWCHGMSAILAFSQSRVLEWWESDSLALALWHFSSSLRRGQVHIPFILAFIRLNLDHLRPLV